MVVSSFSLLHRSHLVHLMQMHHHLHPHHVVPRTHTPLHSSPISSTSSSPAPSKNDGEENKYFVNYSGGTIYFVDEGLRE